MTDPQINPLPSGTANSNRLTDLIGQGRALFVGDGDIVSGQKPVIAELEDGFVIGRPLDIIIKVPDRGVAFERAHGRIHPRTKPPNRAGRLRRRINISIDRPISA